MALQDLPVRLTTGAYIAHSGWEKWNGDEETAKGIHGMATGAYPFLGQISPQTFLKMLGAAEIAIGGALLAPLVSNRRAGALLTGFSGGLLGLYWRTPALHQPGSIWPTQAGVGVSKDVWMFGAGLGLLASRKRRKAPVVEVSV